MGKGVVQLDGVIFCTGQDEVGVGIWEGEVWAGGDGVGWFGQGDGALGFQGLWGGTGSEEVLGEDVAVDGVG